ncbi:LytR/AlgR family response regulator transcription factor [Planctobacterium marinum]|uniref:LytR/AlgR family response regulator transcription factor n=1 Tax=Planctobacterium marinum TaxID=1631968 RepID=UPI001E5FA0A3|nr:LytTR family DNA-binding domain-containing protein [Planctobacterium marinum]MCC2604546.1 LytTR family transcriptional regulator [Planctobacterium marinum]
MNDRQLMIWLFVFTLSGLNSNHVHASAFFTLPYNSPVTVCPWSGQPESPPDFNATHCQTTQLRHIDPQKTIFWVQIKFDLGQSAAQFTQPLGLFVSAKAASSVYLNGTLLGHNGQPADTKAETPGAMDTAFPIPASLLTRSENSLVMLLSGQHSIISLDYPVHIIGIGTWGKSIDQIQPYLIAGLVLLGAFSVGLVYFLVLCFGRNTAPTKIRFQYPMLVIMCSLAMLQLSAELSRGLIEYPYPWQDIRLITITVCSYWFGVMLLSYNSMRTARKRAIHWIYPGSCLSLLAIILVPSFDAKVTLGILLPVLFNLVQIACYLRTQNSPELRQSLFIHLSIAIVIFFSASSFHEFTHFVIIAVVLLVIFIQQASDYKKQQSQLNKESAQVAKLEFRLAQQSQYNTPTKLQLSSAGKLELIDTPDIAYCKASGDYVELHLKNHHEKLFSGSLKQLENLLPDTFLRVHRSYLVNLNEVTSLFSEKHSESPQHFLVLSSNQHVPVSRRLLPLVRDSLKSTAILSN